MAQYWLVNTVRLQGRVRYAGESVNDVAENADVLRAAGAVLYPVGASAAVDFAGGEAQSRRKRGAPPADYEGLMSAAYVTAPVSQPLVGDLFVDPVNGNDAHNGSSSAPIKTNAEVSKRLNAALITKSITITYASYPPTTDPLRLDMQVRQATATQVVVKFQAPPLVVKKSGTIGAVTARVRSTNTPWAIPGTAFDGTDVGQRIRINAGARLGATAIIAKDNGGNSVRTGEWGVVNVPGIFATYVTPALNDTYDVLTASGTLSLDYLRVRASTPGATYPNQPTVLFIDWDMAGNAGNGATSGYSPIRFEGIAPCFINCRTLNGATILVYADNNSYDTGYTYWLGCGFVLAPSFQGAQRYGSNYLDGCVSLDYISATSGWLGVTGGTIVQGKSIIANFNGRIDIEDCGVFDWVVFGSFGGGFISERLGEMQNVSVLFGNSGIWGSSAVANTVGLDVMDQSVFTYGNNALLFVTGALATHFRLAGRTSTEPFDITANAYATARTNTWAHLAATIAGGGFADNANDVTHQAFIFKQFAG